MECINVKCPLCGSMNEGVDLVETEGWVECSCCKTDFMAPCYTKRLITALNSIPELSLSNAEKIKSLAK